jgi:AcrR family transcriptional regulator
MSLFKDEVRGEILRTARKIFSRFGFKKTTMDEIAAASRKAKSSIYYYFKSKEEIFEAVVESESAQLKAEIKKAVDVDGDAKIKLKNYVKVRLQSTSELVNFYEALKNDYLSHLEFIERIRRQHENEEIEMVEMILKQGVISNDFKQHDSHLAAIAIVTAIKGLEIPLFNSHENANVDQRIEGLLQVLFYGIVKE